MKHASFLCELFKEFSNIILYVVNMTSKIILFILYCASLDLISMIHCLCYEKKNQFQKITQITIANCSDITFPKNRNILANLHSLL